MFRLEDRQLHILTGLLFGASILLFCLFALGKLPQMRAAGTIRGMKDFSEAWVCSYVPRNAEKRTDKRVEVVNAPASVNVKADRNGKSVTLTHKLPEMGNDPIYLMMETRKQHVEAQVGTVRIYDSDPMDDNLSALHVIPVGAQYRNGVINITITSFGEEDVQIGSILSGNYSELLIQAVQDGGLFALAGGLIFVGSLFLLAVWLFARNKWRHKKLLLYSCMEGILIGSMLLLESRLVAVLVNWNYGLYFVKVCLVILETVAHLMVLRCFLYKKRVLFFTDIGILFFSIYFVSMMVLQAFALLKLDQIYMVSQILFAMMVLIYTIMLGIVTFRYGRRETAPGLIAGVLLVLSFVAWLILPFLQAWRDYRIYMLPLGCVIYMVLSWGLGLKRQQNGMSAQQEKAPPDEASIRRQVVEQLNPNLIFAAFQTLQNLIKSGSELSVKMIYYVSVYLKGNLKAAEHQGEIISFEEELDHILAYLQMQKTRNKNLQFKLECKEKEFHVPCHCLEPFVENAIQYGIAQNGNSGNVVFRSYLREEGYAVQVIDDGVGFDVHKLKKKGNLNRMIDMLEKNSRAKTEIVSREGKGTVVTVIFPLLENDLLSEGNGKEDDREEE